MSLTANNNIQVRVYVFKKGGGRGAFGNIGNRKGRVELLIHITDIYEIIIDGRIRRKNRILPIDRPRPSASSSPFILTETDLTPPLGGGGGRMMQVLSYRSLSFSWRAWKSLYLLQTVYSFFAILSSPMQVYTLKCRPNLVREMDLSLIKLRWGSPQF